MQILDGIVKVEVVQSCQSVHQASRRKGSVAPFAQKSNGRTRQNGTVEAAGQCRFYVNKLINWYNQISRLIKLERTLVKR